jgi:hypothetical protein
MNHRIKPDQTQKKPVAIKRDDPVAPAWPSYQGTSQYVGTSPSGRVMVYVDPSLGAQALQNAQDLVNDADRVVTANDGIFGTIGGPVSVIVFALGGNTDGTGGADHMGCDYITGAAIEVDASFGNSARVSALFEAELSECSMGGNLCGVSTGEALSRWCATVVGNNALADFATGPQWVQDGMSNWVDQTENTDQDAGSVGCGMAFISWLISQSYGLEKIAPAMVSLGAAGTLAQLYGQLIGDDPGNAWTNFQNAIQNLPNGANSITSDDPFNGLAQPLQMVSRTQLRINSHGEIPVSDVRELLLAFEHAYNCLLIFHGATETTGAASGWIPNSASEISGSQSMVLPADRLVLSSVQLSSPGFWAFLGGLIPLETIRKYLQDRHERRKDLEFRNDQERRAKEVEIRLRETELIDKQVAIALQAGIPRHVVASMVNELVARPLVALGALQDRGVITIDSPPMPISKSSSATARSSSRRLLPPGRKVRGSVHGSMKRA